MLRNNDHAPQRVRALPGGASFLRSLLRLWLALFFRKTRVLRAESFPEGVPVLLAIGHPGSFLDALVLIAAFDSPVRCLLDRGCLQGFWRKSLAARLGIVACDFEGDGWSTTVALCAELWAGNERIAVFADFGKPRAKDGRPCMVAPTLALEAQACFSGALRVSIVPIHLFIPVARPSSGEVLIYIDRPVPIPQGVTTAEGVTALAAAVGNAWLENGFCLRADDLRDLLGDLGEVLRHHLEEQWGARPNWKQKVEGFVLSRFTAGQLEQLNVLNAGRVVALREGLERYAVEQRRWFLRRFGVECAGAWIESRFGRARVWLESLIGLPTALYGLINHLLPGMGLAAFGLLKDGSSRGPKLTWFLRGLVVLACYSLQVFVVARWLGRAAAGLYAPTLPLAGAYLWRYVWLLRHRTRPVFWAVRCSAQTRKLQRMRQALADELDRSVRSFAGLAPGG